MDYNAIASILQTFGYPTLMSFMMFYLVVVSLRGMKKSIKRLDQSLNQIMIAQFKMLRDKEVCQKSGDG